MRQLKSAKAAADAVKSEVNTLLNLKAEYKKVTGQDWSPQSQKPAATPTPAADNKVQYLLLQASKV